MNRIEERFQRLKREGQKGFVVYIGAGDPDLDATHDLALAFDEIGVDVLELGVPFSDPLADGLVNQLAAQRGLDADTTPDGVLETVTKIRGTSQIPIVLYVYFNILHKRGLAAFVQAAAKAWETETGQPVHLQYGGSGALLSSLQLAPTGDLYVAAEQSYFDLSLKHI